MPDSDVRVDHAVSSGTFSLDGQTFDVDNNVWLLGDDDEVLVLDAPHDADAIAAAVGDRTVVAVACTHAHDDHVRFAPEPVRLPNDGEETTTNVIALSTSEPVRVIALVKARA